MDAIPQNSLHAPLLEVPDPPEEFGQDGGKFYKAYDALAEEIDDDMTKSLKEQLDGMLVFAGLFAGVNTAFLALTLPLLSADPADDTNALLVQNNAILMQLVSGRNDSVSLEPTLPSKSFAPSGAILSVNVLFSLSLAFAIISSFLAVLGRQWLVYYRKRSGGGPDRQRWSQLRRFLGAQRWGLELILDDILPSLLQIGLIIFCVSLIIYLHTVNDTLSKVVGVPLYLGLATFVGSAICTIWDKFCPFHSPLSHFLQWILTSVPIAATKAVSWGYGKAAKTIGALMSFIPRAVRTSIRSRGRLLGRSFGRGPLSWVGPVVRRFNKPLRQAYRRTKHSLSQFFHARKEEDEESLKVIAIQRTICTSEDPGTLLHATANIMAISELDHRKQLWADEQFRDRFFELQRSSYYRALRLEGRDQFNFAASAARLYRSVAIHIVISVYSSEVYTPGLYRAVDSIDETRGSCFWVPENRLASSSPVLILASAASSFLSTVMLSLSDKDDRNVRELYNYLINCCAASKGQHWRLLSLVSWMVARLPDHRDWYYRYEVGMESLKRSYLGTVDDVHANFDLAVKVLLDPKSKDLLDCDRMLLEILQRMIRLVGDRQASEDLEPETLLQMLKPFEVALRSNITVEATRQAMGELRIGVTTAVTRHLSPDALYPPTSLLPLFDTLAIYFEQLLSSIGKPNQLSAQEDIDVLQAFSPLMNSVFLLKLYIPGDSGIERIDRWEDAPEELREKRIFVRRTFNNFVLEVDKGFCQRHARRVRDPDAAWCCWRDDQLSACIVSVYSLRPDPEPENDALRASEIN